ncbi:hypothetical protein Cgig2_001547 [Carnegiea gigantea]|uniref:Carboxypeptidase n=1 Tax=Carnegiea gigantea TaxID=171969 RepID=A0A9Q1GNA7_9CARY|nr:hypothetical protein Cgig2_001547 [Carnegiea gigantea]
MGKPTIINILGSLLLFCSVSLANQESDRVIHLPGQPENVNFAHYSGYVTVNKSAGRALFYWFIESPSNHESKPLVLWLNGGPGCSSIAYGAAEEIGPFHINSDGKTLYLNPYAWNKLANLLFLESPAGVGFSYSNTTSDLYTAGDNRTACLRSPLSQFCGSNLQLKMPIDFSKDGSIGSPSINIETSTLLEKVTQFAVRLLWFIEFLLILVGYLSGHYVPQLSQVIYRRNNGIANPVMNFKGFMVGNGVTDDYYDYIGTFEYWWTHGLISDSTYKSLNDSCPPESSMHPSATCNWALDVANSEFGNIDPYSIYTHPCNTTGEMRRNLRGHYPWMKRAYDPCTERYSKEYFNLPEVQKALHANKTKIPYAWDTCSNIVGDKWADSPISMLPIYQELMEAGLRIWVYSGDTDAVVPVTATRYSLDALKLPTVTKWYPWYDKRSVGGWSEIYKGLTFVTIRGAGHEVPLHRPRQAFILFHHFLKNKPMPNSTLNVK